jgi:predicted dienelactone hydrolase
MGKRLFLVIVIGALILTALPVNVVAQEGEEPVRTGIRPDAPPYGVRGPYWVGSMELEAETPSHPTKITIWYPALNPEGAAEVITYFSNTFTPGVNGHALLDAAPDAENGPFPFVIYATGWNSWRFAGIYLCEHLASHGFVVMSIDYLDNPATTYRHRFHEALFTRPGDVTWQIDLAAALTETEGDLEGMIDTERIAVTGISMGGYTALAAAGAQLDLTWYRAWCEENPDVGILPPEAGNFDICPGVLDFEQDLATRSGLSIPPEGLWPSWGDPRVDAIAPLSPGATYFGLDGFRNVDIPVMLIGGSADRFVPPEFHVIPPFEHLGSENKSFVMLENADHLVSGVACAAAPWLIDSGLFWACSDPVWDMDRAHDLIDHLVTAFLLAELYGDEDAAAALAPDAVDFSGITYETTGY